MKRITIFTSLLVLLLPIIQACTPKVITTPAPVASPSIPSVDDLAEGGRLFSDGYIAKLLGLAR